MEGDKTIKGNFRHPTRLGPQRLSGRKPPYLICGALPRRRYAYAYAFTRELEKLHPDKESVKICVNLWLETLASFCVWAVIAVNFVTEAETPISSGK